MYVVRPVPPEGTDIAVPDQVPEVIFPEFTVNPKTCVDDKTEVPFIL